MPKRLLSTCRSARAALITAGAIEGDELRDSVSLKLTGATVNRVSGGQLARASCLAQLVRRRTHFESCETDFVNNAIQTR
jgi:hypothetical protein